MIEFVKELSLFQWVLIGVGVFLLFPVVKDFFIKQEAPDTPNEPTPQPPHKIDTGVNDLTSIVHKWEVLYNACEKMGLEEAQGKLQEVFPMFAKLRKLPETKSKRGENEYQT